MRVSAIKKELDERGVGYRGLFEKSEFVDLLVDARANGITAPPPSSSGDTDGGAGSGGGASAQAQDKADAAYKDVEVRRRLGRDAPKDGFGLARNNPGVGIWDVLRL